jgi:prepilin-type N-terminal cleavage/methylation domain-containing protein
MIRQTAPIRGFTLLELLVAMSIMVVIASCLYSTLYTGFNARRIGLVAVEPDVAAISVIELMKQDFLGTVSPAAKLGGAFVGTDLRSGSDDTDDVSFYTTSISGHTAGATAYARTTTSTTTISGGTNVTGSVTTGMTGTSTVVGGVAKVEYALVDNEQQANYRLVRRVTTNLLSQAENPVPEEQVLCRSVKSLNFRVYDGNDWADSWDSTTDANSLPLAVEITIGIAYDDSHANGAASVLSYNDRVRVVASEKTYKVRMLREAFLVPCGGEAVTTTTASSDDSTSGGSTSGGSTSGGGGGGGGGAGS